MLDKEIASAFVAILQPAMAVNAILASVKLARNYQSRQSGASSGSYVYFHKISDTRYGHTQRREIYNPEDALFEHREVQLYESIYQFTAMIAQNPSNTTDATESDIINELASVMQSDKAISDFRDAGIGILRITSIRNPYVLDDKDQFEALPSFDVILTHERVMGATTPTVATFEANLSRV